MNVIKKAIKGISDNFKKFEDMDETDISLNTQSPLMREKTREWWRIFRGAYAQKDKNFNPIPMAYISTAYLARLATSEISFELPDERLNAYVQKNLVPELDRIVQLTLVGGYTVIKPYMTKNGEVFFDVGTSEDFLPIAFDENGHIIEGTFTERVRYNGRIYVRREHHAFYGGIHRIENYAYLFGTRRGVEMTEVPRWAELAEYGEIPSDIPMIATFRTPYANNIDLESPLPISMFANSVDTLREIDETHSEYISEFRKMRAKVFADETVLGKHGITDDYFVSIDGDGITPVDKQIMTYAPPIREEAHKAAVNTELGLYEMQIGVSSGTFTFGKKGLVTATQVLSEDRTTFNTVGQIQRQLRSALETIAEITVRLARFYGYDAIDGKPAIEFGDGVFEDTDTEFNRRFQMVKAGLLKPENFVSWYFGVPIDKARELLPKQSGSTEDYPF